MHDARTDHKIRDFDGFRRTDACILTDHTAIKILPYSERTEIGNTVSEIAQLVRYSLLLWHRTPLATGCPTVMGHWVGGSVWRPLGRGKQPLAVIIKANRSLEPLSFT